jgi:hypothetical protein
MLILQILNYCLKPRRLLSAIRHPQAALRNLYILFTHPQCRRVCLNVEGLISLSLGTLLYDNVLKSKLLSPNVIEVGAFKGASTCYLSLAAVQVGKRVKSFELFSGLPVADAILDPHFHVGDYSSDVAEYERNVKAWGSRDIVDLIIGDARQTLLPAIAGKGFSVAFLDVDVYEVMRELLSQLWREARGGEVIIVHDVNSPGVRKAVDEFHVLAKQLCKEIIVESGSSSILVYT